MKAVIFSPWFEAPDKLLEFYMSIGHVFHHSGIDFKVCFDPKVVEFCESHSEDLWGEKVYKGRSNYRYRIGFAGAGYIRDIDTNRKWRIGLNSVESPVIEYIDVVTDEFGQTQIFQAFTKN